MTLSSMVAAARLLALTMAVLTATWAVLSLVQTQPAAQSHINNNDSLFPTNPSSSSSLLSHPQRRRHHGVLCFGDSLTAGTTDRMGVHLYPYSQYLQQALENSTINVPGNNERLFEVHHLGFPGWTAQEFVQELDHPQRGLRTAIRNWNSSSSSSFAPSPPPLDLVILLAGTNDLGKRKDETFQAIARDIVTLHDECWKASVPRTIVLGIPPSAYQSRSSSAAELAASINGHLEQWAQTKKPRATYVPFPFAYNREEMFELWYQDGLHLSEAGYRILGQSLQPIVLEVLEQLDMEQ